MKWDEMTPDEINQAIVEKVLGQTVVCEFCTDNVAALSLLERFSEWGITALSSGFLIPTRLYICRVSVHHNHDQVMCSDESLARAICHTVLKECGAIE